MLNPTLHVLLVSAQATDIGQYITLSFTTALRLHYNCRALAPDELDARTLLMALARRANLLAEFDRNGPLVGGFAPLREACAGIRDDKHLACHDWTHHSSRQRQKMTLPPCAVQRNKSPR